MTACSRWPRDFAFEPGLFTDEASGDLQGLWGISVLQSQGEVLSTIENDIL